MHEVNQDPLLFKYYQQPFPESHTARSQFQEYGVSLSLQVVHFATMGWDQLAMSKAPLEAQARAPRWIRFDTSTIADKPQA
jgi:hypothetical protein